jgi:type IV pilus assembly protein PilW
MNPNGLPEPTRCGTGWALNIALPVDGENNQYALPCAPEPGAQVNSDVITVRRASVAPVSVDTARLQIQTSLIQGEIFSGRSPPASFSLELEPETGLPASATHNLVVSSYYVASDSRLIPGVPTLRRKRLGSRSGAPWIVDEEVIPGVENLQIQLGIDIDADNAVDRYIDPGSGARLPGARVLTARIWLLVRGVAPENGIIDPRNYQLGDVSLGSFSDRYRRMLISKTILLRNVRT